MGEMAIEVLHRLPHRPPFRFVSEVTLLEPRRRAEGVWRVSSEEEFFRGHFPGEPLVPGVLLAEALAQLAGLVAFAETSDDTSRAARLAQVSVKFLAGVTPPASIALHAMLAKEMSGLFLFEVRAEIGGAVAVAGSLVLASAAAGDRARGVSS
jgi:3-hydroxyacyl-[acyl-carrier-protein] dehydratase